jgi:hypothetical protein
VVRRRISGWVGWRKGRREGGLGRRAYLFAVQVLVAEVPIAFQEVAPVLWREGGREGRREGGRE